MAKRILVVEDEHAVARTIQVNLDREGFTTQVASNGAAGLAAVASAPPDLIILDVVMPGMDGFEVLRSLKADPLTADIPVVMLTAKSDQESILRGWSEGVHCYMTKPFDPRDLTAFVQRLLDADELGDGDI